MSLKCFSWPTRQLPLIAAIAIGLSPALSAAANPFTQGRANDASRVMRAPADRPMPYLIEFDAPAVARAAQERGFARTAGSTQADLHSAEAIRYREGLRAAQTAFLGEAARVLQRTLAPISAEYQFQHAFNGMAVRLTPAEAKQLADVAGVRELSPMRLLPVATDRGPQLIGAQSFWSGLYDSITDRVFLGAFEGESPLSNRGEGTVVGVIDTGLNFASPSFTATDAGGYRHVNPLGEGTYLGLCGPEASPEWTPKCNDKVIGAYGYVDALMPDILHWDPAAINGPGPEDDNGHGSHTASTAAGNAVRAQVPGGPLRDISGVAPHANIVVFDACYTDGNGGGSCPNIALLASIDRAVADGVVDVLNYSISGGNDPWRESQSMAFLDAVDAGIFVAAAAGNSGPSPGWIGHVEPWVTTVAATTHERGPFVNKLRLTGPAPVPAPLTDITITFPSSSVPLSEALNGPLAHNAADPLQCEPAAPGSYAGKIVMIRRGTCTFVDKIHNVEAGNATAVVLVNTDDTALNPVLDDTHIPVAVLPKSQGDAIAAFLATAADSATARLDYPSAPTTVPIDQVARFSSRGPADIAQLKPDVAAPGVDILAALNGAADAYGLLSGTSMATPHVAGAAALLRKARPQWTPSEIKSALMLTAKTAGVTDMVNGDPASPLLRGAGRARADLAYHSGLVMDESSYHYLQADPDRNGKPETLNVPSLGAHHCLGTCSFKRTFRNTTDAAQTWKISLNDVAGTVTPDTLTLAPGASGSVTFGIDVSDQPQDRYAIGEVLLTPLGSTLQTLHMPVAVYVDPFEFELTPRALNVTANAGATTTATFTVRNKGNAGLNWELLSGTQRVPVINQPPNTRDGLVSSMFADANIGAFVGDDIVLDQPTRLRKLTAYGSLFAYYGDTPDMYATSYTWAIYADANGQPAGYPGGPVAPLHTINLAPNAAGVTPATDDLEVDLDVAGIDLTLPAGTYWLVAYPTFPAHIVNGVEVIWFRTLMNTQDGYLGKVFNNDPSYGGTVGATHWHEMTDDWPGHLGAGTVGLADRLCTPAWASASQQSGALGANAQDTVTLTVDTSGLTAGTHVSQLCVQSNDPNQAITLLPLQLTVR